MDIIGLPSKSDLENCKADVREMFPAFRKWVIQQRHQGALKDSWMSLDKEHQQILVKFIHRTGEEKPYFQHQVNEVLRWLAEPLEMEKSAAEVEDMLPSDNEMTELMHRSQNAFEMLTGLLLSAAAEREADRFKIEQVRVAASEKYTRADDEVRYVLFGGLVSAGKTTLVNAFICLMLPELQEELKHPPELLPTDYNENTAIVTEVRFSSTAKAITTTLMQALMTNADDANEMGGRPSGHLFSSKLKFEPAPGYPQTYPISGAFRKLQKDIKRVIGKKNESRISRMVIEVPCPAVGTNPLSIIDTPGLDSPFVWQQIQEEISTKAFVLVWVGALDAPASFGLQGRRLLDLYNKTGQILPPALILTKWDLLEQNPSFKTPGSRIRQAKRRISELRAGLCPKGLRYDIQKVACHNLSDLQAIQEALVCSKTSRQYFFSDEKCCTWKVTKNLALEGQVLLKGFELTEVWKDTELIYDAKGKTSLLEDILKFPLPVTISFRTQSSEMPVMLATTNASGFLHGTSKGEDVAQVWEMLQKLLSGLADPMRLSKRLTTVMAGTQQAMNILLQDDLASNLFQKNREEYMKVQQSVIEKFSFSVDAYFSKFPTYITKARFQKMQSMNMEQREPSQVSCLSDYSPPRGLSSDTCAICQLPQFIHVAHEEEKALQGNNRYDYVKNVAQKAIDMWYGKFQENLHRYEQECAYPLTQMDFAKSLPLHGVDVRHWAPTVVELEMDSHCFATFGLGTLVGAGAGALSLVAPPVPVIAIGSYGALMGLIGLCILPESSMVNSHGFWEYDSAREDAMQSVLDVLNKDDVQEAAKKSSIDSFQARLENYMHEFANFRSLDIADSEESRVARTIRQDVEESIFRLSAWFARFISNLITNDNPWILPPPADLQGIRLDMSLSEDAGYNSASDTEDSENEELVAAIHVMQAA
mmetsp:Transcript_45989/g.80086  ORF Transcript_45989/g.80086 Transcript_45989/m.80086 type:complete len:931 (+) Transcript_45989:73-2865(+)